MSACDPSHLPACFLQRREESQKADDELFFICRWGVRFPDMSNAYDIAIRKVAEEIALNENVPIKRGVVGLFVGPLFRSAPDARLAQLGGAHVLTTGTSSSSWSSIIIVNLSPSSSSSSCLVHHLVVGLVPQVIVARHMGMQVGAFSLVSDSLLLHQQDAKAPEVDGPRARLVVRLLHQLASAGGKHHVDSAAA